MICAAKRLLTTLVVAGVGTGDRRVVRSGAALLAPGVGVDSGKVTRDARARVLGDTCGLLINLVMIPILRL